MSKILIDEATLAQQDIPNLIAGALGVSRGTAYDMMREALAEQPAQKCSYPYCGCNSKAWCKVERNEALDKKAENAKEIGLTYEPAPATELREQEPVLQDIEQYRLQMAGISTAAIGYWKEGDSIHPDYDTVALRDVAKLYAKYDALYKAQPAQQEPVAWRNAALRVGEDLCSVGLFGYYDMTAEQWLDWALSVVTVHAPPAQRTWVGLTDDEMQNCMTWSIKETCEAIEAKLRSKNEDRN